jgi:hypothetical protein
MESNYEADQLLQEAVDGGYIDADSKVHGIARFCNDQGYQSLSPAQKAIGETFRIWRGMIVDISGFPLRLPGLHISNSSASV